MENEISIVSEGFKVKTETIITRERLSELLCSALEGGSNYWYVIQEFIEPKGEVIPYAMGEKDEATGKWTGEVFRHLDYPLNTGGALIIIAKGDDYPESNEEVNGKTEFRLDEEAIQIGLAVMANKFPHHFKDFIEEKDDANTGDVFLQCCLFGDVVFG